MNTIITPAEVTQIAFPGSPTNISRITESVIITAQQKFIRPVLNNLYDQLKAPGYESFTNEYVKPALAYYVRYLLLPVLSSQVGNAGVLQPKSSVYDSASDKTIAALKKRTRSDAAALMKRAVDHIEQNPDRFPEYVAADNVMNRTKISGGVVL